MKEFTIILTKDNLKGFLKQVPLDVDFRWLLTSIKNHSEIIFILYISSTFNLEFNWCFNQDKCELCSRNCFESIDNVVDFPEYLEGIKPYLESKKFDLL